jgi:hypothetical protein
VIVRCRHVLVCYHGCETWFRLMVFENRVHGKIRGSNSDDGTIAVAALLRHWSAAARFRRLRVRVLPGHGCLSLVRVVCC